MSAQHSGRKKLSSTTDLADRSRPKTTRVEAKNRREPQTARTAAHVIGRKLDAMPDRIDIRDWFYQPTLAALPTQVVSIPGVHRILDQGNEGACTGFGLAAVINFHLARKDVRRFVSPRMLYEMARRYDEWPGEHYEGSSARGAMIGWVRHGVCLERTWPSNLFGVGNFDDKKSQEARQTPGGAFYRVMHRQVRDMHAALCEVGAVYMTIMVHSGWDTPGKRTGRPGFVTIPLTYDDSGRIHKIKLPVIQRLGHATDGHAVAVVGYTGSGFIIQNSWGDRWGVGGFALLPYEDFMMHATDVWAAQLGVPVEVDVWQSMDAADTTAGVQRASEAIPLVDIRPYVVDCGDSGELSDSGDYWTTEEDIQRLFQQAIPETTKQWSKRRVLIYLHGGLNTEQDVAKRIVAFRDVMLENEIYPLHIMWESGANEIICDLIKNVITEPEQGAGGVADWMHKLRDHLTEAKDRTFEIATARLGGTMWSEMKRNAMLSSRTSKGDGAMQLIAKHALETLSGLSKSEKSKWEFHVVAHSAGSIYFAYALEHLLKMKAEGITFSSVHFMAPAITTELFGSLVGPRIKTGDCPLPSLFILSDVGELDDTVGPYGKSLLYLVSNAFEGTRGVPLVGMDKFVGEDPLLKHLFAGKTASGHPSLVIAGAAPANASADPYSTSRSESHGGFDNDPDTLNSILMRIVLPANNELKRPFTTRDLQY
jgi:Papain family cysteine protease